MRLYTGKIAPIAEEVVRVLVEGGDLEAESVEEVRLDVESVLKEYVRREREVTDEAKTRLEARGLPYGQLGRTKSQVARERSVATGDDALPWLIEQILEILFHSQNVIEIYADDATLRTKITPILRKHMDVDAELDREVRARIKNLEDGTAAFDIEYAKVMEQTKQKKGLT